MSRLIAGMQRERLVRVTPAKEDARSILITPTKLGRDLLLAGKQRRVESLAKALKQCGDPQLESLERSAEVLDQVIRRIANVWVSPGSGIRLRIVRIEGINAIGRALADLLHILDQRHAKEIRGAARTGITMLLVEPHRGD